MKLAARALIRWRRFHAAVVAQAEAIEAERCRPMREALAAEIREEVLSEVASKVMADAEKDRKIVELV